MPPLLALLRPHHWVKNTVVLGPLVFAGLAFDGRALVLAGAAGAAFCLAASAVYALNDWHDAPGDRLHPTKRQRPVAAGALQPASALVLALLCATGAVLLAQRVDARALASSMPPASATGPASSGEGLEALGAADWVLVYLAVNVAYTAWLRRVVVADVVALASGFAIRALAGAAALRLAPSGWLVVCCFCLAAFLAVGKRRLEVAQAVDAGYAPRPVLAAYSPRGLEFMFIGSALLTLTSYTLYTLAPQTVEKVGSRALLATVPMVALGVVRFARRVREGRRGDPVEIVLDDRMIQTAVVLWLATALAVVHPA